MGKIIGESPDHDGSAWWRNIGVGKAGQYNAITDVPGISVGHTTLIEGDGERKVGSGPVRTGVTVVVPSPDIWNHPIHAGFERINGAGEVTGIEWMKESGFLTTPIALTNTHSLGVVRDALVQANNRARPDITFSLPVVGETCDIYLNDINGHHVKPEHVEEALASARGGPVAQGSVGGGTGMICHEFKGGIGSASRLVEGGLEEDWTVGVLVEANHGDRSRLVIDGVPVGRAIGLDEVPGVHFIEEPAAPGDGSIIIVIATDAPLLPHHCEALAKRGTFGLARTGGAGERASGDLAIAFSTTGRSKEAGDKHTEPLTAVRGSALSAIYCAAIEATEQAIVNSMLAAETMTGADGNVVHELPEERLEALAAVGPFLTQKERK
jgi:D-aminopeptidase